MLFMGKAQADFRFFFFFNGEIAVGLVKADGLPRCGGQLAEVLESPSLSVGPFRHAFEAIFGMVGRAVAMVVAQIGCQHAVVAFERFVFVYPLDFRVDLEGIVMVRLVATAGIE